LKSSWIKLVLAISLDGRLSFTPSSKIHLGGVGDRKILEEALAWADASIIGAETLRIHKTTCLIHNKKLIEERKKKGSNQQPICLVASKKVDFNGNLPFFNQPINRWLITNKDSLDKAMEIKAFDEVIIIPSNWPKAIEELNKRGLSKIVLLGGAQLINSFLEEDQVDELQLTLVPKVLGGENTWTSYQSNNMPINMHKSNSWILKETQNLGKNEIMLRYFRNRNNAN